MSASEPRRELGLTVAGSPAGLRQAAEAFARFSEAHRVSDEVRRSLAVVLDELLSNTVKGNRDGRELTIELGFRLVPGSLEVVITDDAAPLNPLEAPPADTTSPLEKRPIGGVGVLLVRHLVDGIGYECVAGRNRVMLDKRLDG